MRINSPTRNLRPRRPVGELVYVSTSHIQTYIPGEKGNRKIAGELSSPLWNPPRSPICEFPKIAFCIEHWVNGVPWAETGAFDRMMAKIRVKGSADGCHDLESVIRRYEALDSVFEEVRAEGALRPAGPPFSRDHKQNGLLVHFGRGAEPIFGLGGCHRMAIAIVLELPTVPVLVGRVHPTAHRLGLTALET